MAKIFSYFVAIIMISLFYGFSSTVIAYAMAPFGVSQVTLGSYQISGVNATDVSTRISAATQSQMKLPLIEIGALVFYTGNILIDLMMNSFFAIPSLFTLLSNTFFHFFTVDVVIAMQLKIVTLAIVSIGYFIGMIGLLMEIRGQGAQIV